jgi:adenylate cyclase
MTALGDVVNTAARLSALARAGEVLVSARTATDAGLDPRLERVRLELNGKRDPMDAVRLVVGSNR